MKKHLRVISLILAMLLCASVLVACKGDGDESSTGTTSTSGNSDGYTYGPADYGEFPYKDHEKEDATIRILCVETARHRYGEQQFGYLEENEGDTINTAVNNRNNLIEETYGITFELTPVKFPTDDIARLVTSSADDYELICDSVDRLVSGIPEGYYYSLDGIMNINHPWWDAQAIETLALGDKHFLLAGAGLLTDDDNTYLTIYNKDMFKNVTVPEDFGIEEGKSIYDIVRDGEFTIDLYYEFCKQVSKPDDNGQWGLDATYGNLSHTYGATIMANGCNVATIQKNENDELYLNVATEYSVNAFDKVYKLMSDAQNTQLAENLAGQFGDIERMFVNGQGLFYNTTSTTVSRLKSGEQEFDFGVLPIPKLNKEQENYCCSVNRYHSSALAIPTTVPQERLDLVTFALQALSFYSTEVVRAYYQTTLKLQAAHSDDDAEMLDIVYNNRFYDVGAIYGWGSIEQLYSRVIRSANNSLTAEWERIKGAVETDMKKAVEAYNKAA